MVIIATIGAFALFASSFATVSGLLGRVDRYGPVNILTGALVTDLRLTGVFLLGAGYSGAQDHLRRLIGPGRALMCAIAALVCLFIPHLAELALVVFGGMALFWLAFDADIGVIQKINDSWDISYGTYLYGWPIAIGIVYFNRGISPWLLASITVPLAWIAGTASWAFVERRTKDLVVLKRSTVEVDDPIARLPRASKE